MMRSVSESQNVLRQETYLNMRVGQFRILWFVRNFLDELLENVVLVVAHREIFELGRIRNNFDKTLDFSLFRQRHREKFNCHVLKRALVEI